MSESWLVDGPIGIAIGLTKSIIPLAGISESLPNLRLPFLAFKDTYFFSYIPYAGYMYLRYEAAKVPDGCIIASCLAGSYSSKLVPEEASTSRHRLARASPTISGRQIAMKHTEAGSFSRCFHFPIANRNPRFAG